jgi:hypothetical protein
MPPDPRTCRYFSFSAVPRNMQRSKGESPGDAQGSDSDLEEAKIDLKLTRPCRPGVVFQDACADDDEYPANICRNHVFSCLHNRDTCHDRD